MNQHILKLFDKSGLEYNFDPMLWLKYEHFAELIVQECCTMMLDLETKYPANLTIREIKNHFGLKE